MTNLIVTKKQDLLRYAIVTFLDEDIPLLKEDLEQFFTDVDYQYPILYGILEKLAEKL